MTTIPTEPTIWTEERLEVLSILADQGLSSSDIATEMGKQVERGLTSNAIRQQCTKHRIKLKYKPFGMSQKNDVLGVKGEPSFFKRWINAKYAAANKEPPRRIFVVFKPPDFSEEDEALLDELVGWWTGGAYAAMFIEWCWRMAELGFTSEDDVEAALSGLEEVPVWFSKWSRAEWTDGDVRLLDEAGREEYLCLLGSLSAIAALKDGLWFMHDRRIGMIGRLRSYFEGVPVGGSGESLKELVDAATRLLELEAKKGRYEFAVIEPVFAVLSEYDNGGVPPVRRSLKQPRTTESAVAPEIRAQPNPEPGLVHLGEGRPHSGGGEESVKRPVDDLPLPGASGDASRTLSYRYDKRLKKHVPV